MKKVLITGASDWLGLALAKLLIADWVEVVNISRRKPPIDIHHIQCELTDEESIKNVIEQITHNHSEFDAIVNNIWCVYYHPVESIPFNEMTKALQVNIASVASLTSWLIPMIKKNGSDVIIVSATLGFKAFIEQAAYTSWTRWKRWLARYFQLELKDTTSRVISFCPWAFQSRMHEKVTWKVWHSSQYMPVEWVALCMKQILELPKYMEVSEIVINRKVASI